MTKELKTGDRVLIIGPTTAKYSTWPGSNDKMPKHVGTVTTIEHPIGTHPNKGFKLRHLDHTYLSIWLRKLS